LPIEERRWRNVNKQRNILGTNRSAACEADASTIGLTRQSVRAVTAELVSSATGEFKPNPHHRRAHLVVLTPKGEAVERAARARQLPWARALGKGVGLRQIGGAVELLQTVLARLEQAGTLTEEM
jgi:DNA-binding MarR family transcriptional regulator